MPVATPLTEGQYTLLAQPTLDFGYPTVTVDMATSGKTTAHDEVTLNLADGHIVGAPAQARAPGGR